MPFLTQQLRDDVARRARQVTSERELRDVIFRALTAAQIDWRQVDSEDAKQLLTVAVRTYRKNSTVAAIPAA